MILIEKLQKYQPYLSSCKIDKDEYLTGKKMLPSNQKQLIEQAIFTYSSVGKPSEKQTKTLEDQGQKQIKAIEDNKNQSADSDLDCRNKLRLSNKR